MVFWHTHENEVLRLLVAFCLIGFLIPSCRNDVSSEEVQFPEHIEAIPYDTELSNDPEISVKQVVHKPTEIWGVSSDGPDVKTAKGEQALLGDMILSWIDFSGIIVIDADLPQDRRYDVKVEAKGERTISEIVQSSFETIFSLRFQEQIESHQIWIIEKSSSNPANLEPVESDFSSWGTAQTSGGFGYEFRAGSMEDLADILSKYLDGGLVFDETGLEGFFRFELAMDHWKPETAIPALKPLGLKVRQVGRDFPTLRVAYEEEKPNLETAE